MDELIAPGTMLVFPDTLTGENREAATHFMQFLNDQSAYAPNTVRDLQLSLRAWMNWCKDFGCQWFPLEHGKVREYLLWMHNRELASTTISKHYAMLNMFLSHCNLPLLSTSKSVSLAMRRIRREAATVNHERTGQAVPLQWADLRLLDVLFQRGGRTVDIRNRAFLFVAYNSLLRMSEMSRIRVRDLEITGDVVTLHVGHTKTTTTVAGVDKQLARCTTAVINDWLELSGLGEFPDAVLFPPVFKSQTAKVTDVPLSAPALEKIFSDAHRLAGKPEVTTNKGRYSRWTGHSARVGAAIDMAESNVSLVEIMREGTWKKPETLMRYLRKSQQNAGANSRLMDG